MLNQVSREIWQDVALDFVTKLPLSKKLMTGVIYDSIIIVTDRLTKYTYFISYLESSSAENLAYIFHKHVMANHRVLNTVRAGFPAGIRGGQHSAHANCGSRGRPGMQIPSGIRRAADSRRSFDLDRKNTINIDFI
jgi:hypothetical protein